MVQNIGMKNIHIVRTHREGARGSAKGVRLRTKVHQKYNRFFANNLQFSRCVKESGKESDRHPVGSVEGRCENKGTR